MSHSIIYCILGVGIESKQLLEECARAYRITGHQIRASVALKLRGVFLLTRHCEEYIFQLSLITTTFGILFAENI